MIVNDFLLIDELRCWRDHYTLDKPALRQSLQSLGDEAAGYLKGVLAQAVRLLGSLVPVFNVVWPNRAHFDCPLNPPESRPVPRPATPN